jgi:hypothetical protein
MLEAVFSERFVPMLYNEEQLPLQVSRERLQVDKSVAVAEAGDSSGTERKGNVRLW